MESVIHERLDQPQVEIDDLKDLVLEVDEVYNFSEELVNAKNTHKKALVEYNDSYNYNQYNKLQQKINLLNSLDTFDSEKSKRSKGSNNGEDESV